MQQVHAHLKRVVADRRIVQRHRNHKHGTLGRLMALLSYVVRRRTMLSYRIYNTLEQ